MSGAEGEQAIDLRLLVARSEIEMQPVLGHFVVGHLDEEEVRSHIELRAAGGRLYDRLVSVLVGDAPPQSLGPETGQLWAVARVDDEALNSNAHRSGTTWYRIDRWGWAAELTQTRSTLCGPFGARGYVTYGTALQISSLDWNLVDVVGRVPRSLVDPADCFGVRRLG